MKLTPCPCQNGSIAYDDCCRPYHEGKLCPNALTLMRSRYSAYVLKKETYLRQSWHPITCPSQILDQENRKIHWVGLEILGFEVLSTQEARVEFIARFEQAGKKQKLHEISFFVCEAGRWLYVEGQQTEP